MANVDHLPLTTMVEMAKVFNQRENAKDGGKLHKFCNCRSLAELFKMTLLSLIKLKQNIDKT